MTKLLRTAGDKLLGKIVPKRIASACTYPTSCTYRFTGCGGGQCFYYYQWWNKCYIGQVPLTGCANPWQVRNGCC